MPSPTDFARHVPGFDFLQGLLKTAGAGLPSVGQWIAPTLDPEELDKRIRDLKTVQFWLEQNAKLLATTIQALEVQRMTLATLKSMNLPMADLAGSLRAQAPAAMPDMPAMAAAAAAAWPTPAASSEPEPEPEPEPEADAAEPEPAAVKAPRRGAASRGKPRAAAAAGAGAAPLVDPMQWWGALTQQFTDLASRAVREAGAAVAPPGAAASPAGAATGARSTKAAKAGKAATKAASSSTGGRRRRSTPAR